mmetsp:Transcript_3372/g.5099  ORF Transcript_3372/g.5099 Transcript_3372/m.5099 type:complete len:178 (+) Transcript_3372:78-611(+)
MFLTTRTILLKQMKPQCIFTTNASYRRIGTSCIAGSIHNRPSILHVPVQTEASTRYQSSWTSTSNAVKKLKAAVELYRINNFSEELPSRCKKQIVNAAAASDTNGRITSEGLWTILDNIGVGKFITKHDIESILLDELATNTNSSSSSSSSSNGNDEGCTARGEVVTIDVDAMLQIL